jgi:glycosyltransferase involved in cell wall biosynthesis
MLGPLDSPTGGMAAVTANLRDSKLQRTTELTVINNGKTTPVHRSLWHGVAAQFMLLYNVYRAINRQQTQVVHIHSCALFSFWRDMGHLILARSLRCRVIWHLHDGTFLQFLSQGNSIKRALIRWALAEGSVTIVLSEGSRKRLRPHAPRVDWRVVANGVAIPTAHPKQKNQQTRFLFIGNLTHRKGAYDLIEAVECAAQQGIHTEIRLAGGEVEPGQRAEIEKRITESPCAQQFKLLGIITGCEKEQVLATSDCIVLPSYAEGLPMVLLEGMAYGLPVIATRIGSIPEAVEEAVEGFLIEPGDVSNLAERIVRLATDNDLRGRMHRAARQRVEKEFSLDTMADTILAIYQEVLRIP